MTEKQHDSETANPAIAAIAAIAGWLIPGLGHALLKRWSKAVIYFLAVAILAIVGLRMRGNVFPSAGGDPFDILGFVADLGSGIFYFLSGRINPTGADVSRAAGDYGTRLFATAGVLNMLFILEVLQIGLSPRGEGEKRQ